MYVHRRHIKTLDATSHFMLVLFTAPSSSIARINQRIEREGCPVDAFALQRSTLLLRPSQQMFYLLSDTASDGGPCPPEANHFHSQIPLQLQSLPNANSESYSPHFKPNPSRSVSCNDFWFPSLLLKQKRTKGEHAT